MRILIADDDLDIRLLLTRILEKWGHEVIPAVDGLHAWKILQEDVIHFVITDWVMPGMDGLELCQKIRGFNFDHYIYIIMLTSRDTNTELVKGMDAGADDFIVKPFKKDELNVRIKAGERLISLETDLSNRNKQLNKAYSVMKKDLEAAGKVQASLLPKSAVNILNIRFDWMFLPSAFVAGDIFNYFRLDETHVGFYLLDVAGHGIPAALLSITLSRFLSPRNFPESLLKNLVSEPPHYEITSPARVIANLNHKFQAEDEIMQYFTMVYGVLDVKAGCASVTQAGHPNPVLLKENGDIVSLGTGGFPVGMFPDVAYDEFEVPLNKGDRIVLYSDGVIECTNKKNVQFSTERFFDLLYEHRMLGNNDLAQKVEKVIFQWAEGGDFNDDITLLILEMKG